MANTSFGNLIRGAFKITAYTVAGIGLAALAVVGVDSISNSISPEVEADIQETSNKVVEWLRDVGGKIVDGVQWLWDGVRGIFGGTTGPSVTIDAGAAGAATISAGEAIPTVQKVAGGAALAATGVVAANWASRVLEDRTGVHVPGTARKA